MPNTIAVMRKMRSAMSAIAPHSVAGRRPDQTLIGPDRRARAGLGGLRRERGKGIATGGPPTIAQLAAPARNGRRQSSRSYVRY